MVEPGDRRKGLPDAGVWRREFYEHIGGGMIRMISVIVAATLAMLAAVGVGRCV